MFSLPSLTAIVIIVVVVGVVAYQLLLRRDDVGKTIHFLACGNGSRVYVTG